MSVLDRIQPLDQLEVESRRVLVRADFDAPLNARGELADDSLLRDGLGTLRSLLSRGARVIVATHLRGRGDDANPRRAPSVEPVGRRLAELLGVEILLTDEPVGDGARKVVQDLRDGRLVLLENLLHYPEGDEAGSPLAKELARYGEVFVHEALGVSHLSNASVAVLPRLFERRGAGASLVAGLEALGRLVEGVRRPFVAVLGGPDLNDSLAALDLVSNSVDTVLIGGRLGYAIAAAQGRAPGRALVDAGGIISVRAALERHQARGTRFLAPDDFLVAAGASDAVKRAASGGDASGDEVAVDLGPETIARFRDEVLRAQSVFWLGTMDTGLGGSTEGTVAVARSIAESAAFSVVVDGETRQVLRDAALLPRISHSLSSPEMALWLLSGRKLPGVEALRQ